MFQLKVKKFKLQKKVQPRLLLLKAKQKPPLKPRKLSIKKNMMVLKMRLDQVLVPMQLLLYSQVIWRTLFTLVSCKG